MNIGTKLGFLLTLTVGSAMFLASFLSLRQREAALESALRDELRAHAVTLQIALEENFSAGEAVKSRNLIDRLRENSRVYAVLLFDENGKPLQISQPETSEVFRTLPEIGAVIENGQAIETVRELDSEKYLSVVTPLRLDERRRGALEIVKPLALIASDIRRARVDWITTTLFLLAIIFLVVGVVLRRSLQQPISKLLEGANAIGHGDLQHRVNIPVTGDELALLAGEFNRMADRLEAQRDLAATETENRVALERELRHTERLASVGRLAAGIAHELGAPLNVIDARAERLLEKPDTPIDKREKNLTIIRTQTDRISRLIRQLLTLARPFDFRLTELDLAEVVASAFDQIAENAERAGIAIESANSVSLGIVGDRDYLQQVFLNISLNAIQAMPNGGRLRVSFASVERDGISFAVATLKDNGPGIADNDLDRIFDPFYTTKDIGEGTGLGLAVSRRIVEEHDGFIEAGNNVEGGAFFSVWMPKKVLVKMTQAS